MIISLILVKLNQSDLPQNDNPTISAYISDNNVKLLISKFDILTNWTVITYSVDNWITNFTISNIYFTISNIIKKFSYKLK